MIQQKSTSKSELEMLENVDEFTRIKVYDLIKTIYKSTLI